MLSEKKAWLELMESFNEPIKAWQPWGICRRLSDLEYAGKIAGERKWAMLERLELFNPGGVDKMFKHFWPANGTLATREKRATACGFLAEMCR